MYIFFRKSSIVEGTTMLFCEIKKKTYSWKLKSLKVEKEKLII